MKETWKLRGAYADWTMTLSAEPSDDDDDHGDTTKFDHVSAAVVDRFRPYFTDVITLVEYRQLAEDM